MLDHSFCSTLLIYFGLLWVWCTFTSLNSVLFYDLRQYSPRFENGIFSNLCLFSVFFVFFSYEYESRTKTKLSRKFNKPNYATSYIVMKIIKIQTCSVPFAKYHATPRHREILQSQIFCTKQILDSLYLVYNALLKTNISSYISKRGFPKKDGFYLRNWWVTRFFWWFWLIDH